MKKGNAIFAFALMNKEGDTESWHIDLKDKGVVAKGDAPKGKKADGRFLFPTYYHNFRNGNDGDRGITSGIGITKAMEIFRKD